MKTNESNGVPARSSDNFSLWDVTRPRAPRRPPGVSHLPQILTVLDNSNDTSINGGNSNLWSSLMVGSHLLNSTPQRPPRNVSTDHGRSQHWRDDDEARRRKLVSVLQEAIRIIDDGETNCSQDEDI